ncbi:winged helix-turn-helix domain-containing protein [Streptomyces tricolor]|nr:winged helix-turn-helix domain-containing protein [Streptomyces tricolor]
MSNEAVHVQPYQRIVQDVRDDIRSGRLTAGAKLPSTRELSDEYGVAPGTVQRALAELRTAGLIYSPSRARVVRHRDGQRIHRGRDSPCAQKA